jgi:hypothetical protein
MSIVGESTDALQKRVVLIVGESTDALQKRVVSIVGEGLHRRLLCVRPLR